VFADGDNVCVLWEYSATMTGDYGPSAWSEAQSALATRPHPFTEAGFGRRARRPRPLPPPRWFTPPQPQADEQPSEEGGKREREGDRGAVECHCPAPSQPGDAPAPEGLRVPDHHECCNRIVPCGGAEGATVL
jgi:hypothetical protein